MKRKLQGSYITGLFVLIATFLFRYIMPDENLTFELALLEHQQ